VANIGIDGFSFGAPVAVGRGGTVVWTNREAAVHSVNASDGSFNSPVLEIGQSWSLRFEAPGTYQYLCAFHPFMLGSVTVR
jgi:plastocyanin